MGNPAGLGALRKVVALFGAAGVVMGVVGACPAAASVSPSGHPNMGGVPGLPSSGLTLAQAPSALRAAVRRTLGVPALRPASTFQQAELTAADGAPGDAFGGSVAISGSTAVVGAPDRNSQTGAAYVFTRSGTTWSQQAELTAADAAAGDYFGISVAISGSTAVVGAYGNNSQTGAAYVFTRSGTAWSQQAELTAADATANALLGVSVAVSSSAAVAGAYGKNSSTGAAYVFV